MTSQPVHRRIKATHPRRDNRSITRVAPWPASVVAAFVVSCCVTAPPALLAVAHLTLAAAAGLGVGVIVVVTVCLLRCVRPAGEPSNLDQRPASGSAGRSGRIDPVGD